MAKKISNRERIIDFCMTEPTEAVQDLIETAKAILKNRSPKTERAKPKSERKARNSNPEPPKVSAAAPGSGE